MEHTPNHSAGPDRGFTLIELIVVVAVMAVLLGSMVPLLSATQAAEKYANATRELDALAEALDAYYFDHAAFPTTVNATGFYGNYALAGIDGDNLKDEWGARGFYALVQSHNPDVATAYSVGENGVDDGVGAEQLKVTVLGAEPGNRRTRMKMRIIAAAIATFLEGGGVLTGSWPADRSAMGLDPSLQADGFGTDFTLSGSSLRSAGADRAFNTTDDLVL